MSNNESWHEVCKVDDLMPNIGVRALVGDKQVALFKVKENIYAIDAIDPFSKVAVLSRGIIGDLQGKVVVASPLYKQHFDLATGQCLEDSAVSVRTYTTRENQGTLELAV